MRQNRYCNVTACHLSVFAAPDFPSLRCLWSRDANRLPLAPSSEQSFYPAAQPGLANRTLPILKSRVAPRARTPGHGVVPEPRANRICLGKANFRSP